MRHQYSLIVLLFLSTTFAHAAATTSSPAPLPIFLKSGFSSVLEFEEPPTRVVLGDAKAFQVERLDRSLVLRTLVNYATTNMFVYFKDAPPRLFVITASEEAEPTYFKKIETPKQLMPQKPPESPRTALLRPSLSQVTSKVFDSKKDYLTIEVRLAANSGVMKPNWPLVRLRHLSRYQAPFKLWAERTEIQKDATLKARFIFARPNVPRNLLDTALIVPVEGANNPLVFNLSNRGGLPE